MLTAPENKLATDDSRSGLLDALLANPAIRKLLPPEHLAVRKRAAVAVRERTDVHNFRLARMEAAARTLIERRDSAKREYEAAELAARDAVDSIEFERRLFAERRTALEEIACAGATGLERLGLTSVEDLERAYLGRRT